MPYFILFLKFYLPRPLVCRPPKPVFLAPKAILWPWCLPTLLNLSGTTCSIYDFPGKFLLSLGSARNCGNQYATYSPSGSYVCACNSRSILGIYNMLCESTFIHMKQDICWKLLHPFHVQCFSVLINSLAFIYLWTSMKQS